MNYKASWDNFTKIVTTAVTVLYLGIAWNLFFFEDQPSVGSRLVIGAILLFSYFISYSLRPISYRITSGELIIRRPVRDVVISRERITSVELLDANMLRWTIRTFGVGGLFGFFGKYYNSKIGKMTWYATRRSKAILIRTTDGKNILVTPDDAHGFTAALAGQVTLHS